MTVVPSVPIATGLFASLDPPLLAGSRCDQCATTVFPPAASCPRCSATEMSVVELPSRGRIWTWTVQGFPPKPPFVAPATFEPFVVAYVDLGDVLVESRILASADVMDIGLPVRLTAMPAWQGAEGKPVVTYAFEPDPEAT